MGTDLGKGSSYTEQQGSTKRTGETSSSILLNQEEGNLKVIGAGDERILLY